MNECPELTRTLAPQIFRNYYYLKSELMDFCRRERLSASGGKAELTDRIEKYLQTGERLTPARPVISRLSSQAEKSLTSVIEENFRCSERHRAFFKSVIGDGFKFNVEFQIWLKANAGKTYADAVTAYKEIIARKKATASEISGQFEYNAYIRAFFEDNKGKSLEQAITCWKHKKSLPGHNAYESGDLAVLETDYVL